VGLQWPPRNERVTIGSGSWLGANVVILPGASLGENVVVAAGSVVRGSFPPRCVIAGAPAKVVRQHDGESWQSGSPRGEHVVGANDGGDQGQRVVDDGLGIGSGDAGDGVAS